MHNGKETAMKRDRNTAALARRAGESLQAYQARLEAIDLVTLTPAEQAELVFQLCASEREIRRSREALLPFAEILDCAAARGASMRERARLCG
jgi:hypothetical protein